jgi:hypothetical protein
VDGDSSKLRVRVKSGCLQGGASQATVKDEKEKRDRLRSERRNEEQRLPAEKRATSSRSTAPFQ